MADEYVQTVVVVQSRKTRRIEGSDEPAPILIVLCIKQLGMKSFDGPVVRDLQSVVFS